MIISKNFSEVISIFDAYLNGIQEEERILKLDEIIDILPVLSSKVWLKVKMGIPLNDVDFLTVKNIQNDWSKETANVFGECEDVYTSNLGSYYITLTEVKNEYGKLDLQKEITEIRDFIFDNMIRGGTLISSIKKGKPDFDLVLSVLPFGLFAPEDLIMVAAVQEMLEKNANLSENQEVLLGIYFTEKYDFVRAEKYLNKANEGNVLFDLFNTYLQQKKESISLSAFIHKPFGNGNIYDKLPYERNPYYPSIGQECEFNVQVNKKGVQGVYLQFEGMDSKISCELVDEALHIYQGKYNIPNEYIGGEYYFGIEGEGIEVSEKYELLISNQQSLNEINFIGSSQQGNVYEIRNNQNTLFIVLQENTLQLFDNKPTIDTNEMINKYLFIENNSVYKGSTILFTFSDEVIQVNELIGKGINAVTLKIVDDSTIYYGFGERYNSINQRGKILDCFVYNQYRDQGTRTYMPMPYYFTEKNYGLYVNTDYYTRFDLQSSNTSVVEVYIETEPSEFFIEVDLLNGNMKEMIQQFILKTGNPKMVPAWVLGPWMSSNNWDRDSVVRQQVELANKYGIPSTVIVLEQWSDETTYYMFNDAQYPTLASGEAHTYDQMIFPEWGRWPDPKGLIDYCHDNGLKFILWQIPIQKYLNQQKHPLKDKDEQYMIEQGYIVKNMDGTPYRIPENWFTDSMLLDFSNEEAKKWWFNKRQYLIDIGVDGFKTDGGEMVYGSDVKFADGSNGRKMRNKYPKEYIKSYYEFAQQNGGITFSRSGYTGAQTYPAHWAGDERSTFDAFERQLISGINSGLSGVIFWGWDLGGFNGDIPTAELFMRSTSMAAFCPIMQYHAESKGEFNQDRTPWNIADRTNTPMVIDVYRFYANTRMNLMPYIYSQSIKSVEECIPLMRALQLEYPTESFDNCYDQFMFGESLLIAPVIVEGAASRKVQLPSGKWTCFWTHEVYEGNQIIEVSANVEQIPVFIKANAAILLNVGESGVVGEEIGNDLTSYTKPVLVVTAESDFETIVNDHLGNEIQVEVKVKVNGVLVNIDMEIEIKLIQL